jgi:hypothetical protein
LYIYRKCSIFVTQLKQSAGVAQRLVLQQINYARVAQFLSSAKIKEIMDTKNYSVEYNELGINQIVIIANSPEWDSVKITLNCMGILVSRQEGHSRFEPVNTIPLEVLRMFADK